MGDDPVVVKRASAGAVEALRREGERVRQASHPGVVSVLRSAPVGDDWELVLAHGGRSLSTLQRPTATQVAGIVAGVCSTLADLHEIGITHGRLDPSHVLIGDNGRPRLCGLGDGSVPASPEDDVEAVGKLLIELLGNDEDAADVNEASISWIRRHADEDNRPLHVNYWDPHTDYGEPREWVQRTGEAAPARMARRGHDSRTGGTSTPASPVHSPTPCRPRSRRADLPVRASRIHLASTQHR